MPVYSPVVVTGLKELQVALALLYPELAAEMKVALSTIVSLVASTAREVAAFQGFAPPGTSGRGTGALIGSIRGGTTLTKAYIADYARNQDYSYPRLYEYGLNRAFMVPAVNLNQDKIVAAVAAVVDAVVDEFNAR